MVIEAAAGGINEGAAGTNEVAALACYTRAFRALRAATILALEGLYLEARVYARDVYESAGLARYLAKRSAKADEWMEGKWVKDNEVRQYAERFVAPVEGVPSSPYREYYRQSSDLHHPTVWGCLPLLFAGPEEPCRPRLASEYSEGDLEKVLHEIASEAVFVCFTIINAAADPLVLWPEWRKAVEDLARELAPEEDWSHLERDWEAMRREFEELRSHMIDSAAIDAELDRHPNSVQNVKRRIVEGRNTQLRGSAPNPGTASEIREGHDR